MPCHKTLSACSALALVMACGSPDGQDDTLRDVRDVRVPMPAPDPAYLDFPGPDAVIEPGQERMTCLHFRYDGEGIAYSASEAKQGKFGHHAVLLKAKKPEAPGTVEDCTKPEDMNKYDLLTITGTSVRPGYGLWLPPGTALVYQSHYLNSSTQPIRVRDVMRFKKMPEADVKEWVAPFATAHIDFNLPAGQDATLTYDCQLPMDSKLVIVFGHMHEYGTRFNAWLGADPTALQELVAVEAWDADYRDNPPIKTFWESPMVVKQGTTLRTRCDWRNTLAETLTFPAEMCSTVGFMVGRRDPWTCRVGDK